MSSALVSRSAVRTLRWYALPAAVAAVVLAIVASPASALVVKAKNGHRYGIVPAIGSTAAAKAFCSTDCSPLIYNGGPVQHFKQNSYQLFWAPAGYSFPSIYTTGMNTWFSNVAHDDYTPGNVFGVTQQYFDLTGPISQPQRFVPYNISNGGQIMDTDPYPPTASTCNDGNPGDTACLTDSQIQAEVAHIISVKHLKAGLENQVQVFTPQHVGSCFDNSSVCSYSFFCAYHNWSGTFLYSDMPWSFQEPGCDAMQFFNLGYANNSPIDPEVGVMSHEMSETMTDPQLNAWFDASGNEIGDKCAYNYDGQGFGTHNGLPNNGSGFYNQVINGGQYMMQTEFSNRDIAVQPNTGCMPTDTDTQPSFTVGIVPNPPVHGSSAQFTANVTDPAGVNSVLWQWGDGTPPTIANPANHTYATAGSKTLTVIVTDGHGNTKRQSMTVSVS